MELAKVHLKLSGLTQNTVVKNNVTPAQLAIYAYMHGQDCVQSITVTAIDKQRTIHAEMQRLKQEFTAERAQAVIVTLFPGIAPALPVTFQSIGYDPEVLIEDKPSSANKPPQHNSAAAAALAEKIRKAAEDRAAEGTAPGAAAPVHPIDLSGALDDTGGYDGDGDDNSLELSDDPLENEMQKMQNEGGLVPAPKQ